MRVASYPHQHLSLAIFVTVAILVAEDGRVEDCELKRALVLTESLRTRLKGSRRGRRGLVSNSLLQWSRQGGVVPCTRVVVRSGWVWDVL